MGTRHNLAQLKLLPMLRRERDPGAARDDSTLIEAARADPEAFEDLYRRYLVRVYAYLRARTDTREDADDLTQEVFERALAALPRYREQGNPFGAWLFRIARNVATDFHRHRRATVAWDLLPEALRISGAPGPEAEVLRRESADRLRGLMTGLDPERRELLALRFAGGLKIKEIADVVGRSEAAVKMDIWRTLRALKERYDEE